MRRVMRDSLVVTFFTTEAAMAAEALCGERGLPGRLVPVPGSVRAGCGLAWKAALGDREVLEAAFAESAVPVEGLFTVGLLEIER